FLSTSVRVTHRATAAPVRSSRVRPKRHCVSLPPRSRTESSRSPSDIALRLRTGVDMSQLNPEIDHLLRRAGFGVSPLEVDTFRDMSTAAAVSYLVDYEGRPDDVDARIGRADHAQVTSRDLFAPDIDIEDARQRWLFRMIHTRRPLQEKMALFWHNHFATAYSKLANDSGPLQAAKMLAYKPGVRRGPQGQLELFRQYALGNFRDLVLQVAMDPAMLVWLDRPVNTRNKPNATT